MIPKYIKIKNNKLPDCAGVYLMKDIKGVIIYIGKAVSLKKRVNSYFNGSHNRRIEFLVSKIKEIDYIEQKTGIEALFLEANLIKKYQPYFNILEKDDKSFSYLIFTKEDYPKPLVIRATDLESEVKYKAIYGPFKSARAVQKGLDVLRKIFPWSRCESNQNKPCFYYHLHQCPGVCVNKISKSEYNKIIKDLMSFFDGKRDKLLKQWKKKMQNLAEKQQYEKAKLWRDRILALDHINDFTVLTKDDSSEIKNSIIAGRIEGYDISNISGSYTVGSMVVFIKGAANKAFYRKFKIKTVNGQNDYASLKEVLLRRFKYKNRAWKHPDLILIDGGIGQVRGVLSVLKKININNIPVIGLVKGKDRKRNDLIILPKYEKIRFDLEKYLDILIEVRDESHRFAIKYHRILRGKGIE